MGDLVLSGIGALLSRILKIKLQDSSIDEMPRFCPWSPATFASVTPPREPVLAAQYNWRRFWDLYSSDIELSDDERLELNHLKQGLQEIHAALQREEKRKADEIRLAIQFRLAQLGMNDDRADYVVHREDYKRGSEKEREYLRLHKNFLYRIYDNRCAKCLNDQNGLDIDHFFFSKNEGGCFQMLHRDGFIVNNAIPLCETCNRSKSDKHYRAFFSQQELLRVMELNAKMNDRLNDKKISKWTRREICRPYK